MEAISLYYVWRGLESPFHKEYGDVMGLTQGVSVGDICSAASWASLHTFMRYYRLDVSEPSVAHTQGWEPVCLYPFDGYVV